MLGDQSFHFPLQQPVLFSWGQGTLESMEKWPSKGAAELEPRSLVGAGGKTVLFLI